MSKGRVTAVLGPTNTGKTHYAIDRMLANFPAEVRRNLDKALEKSAAELVNTMKALAPVDEGTLRDSIRSERVDALTIDIKAGDDAAYYAGWVEYGTTDGKPARPFFMPARRLLKNRIRLRIKRAIRAAVKAAVSGA